MLTGVTFLCSCKDTMLTPVQLIELVTKKKAEKAEEHIRPEVKVRRG